MLFSVAGNTETGGYALRVGSAVAFRRFLKADES
jgi:hypothetical protein